MVVVTGVCWVCCLAVPLVLQMVATKAALSATTMVVSLAHKIAALKAAKLAESKADAMD